MKIDHSSHTSHQDVFVHHDTSIWVKELMEKIQRHLKKTMYC